MTALHLCICAADRCYALLDKFRHLTRGQVVNALSPRVAAASRHCRAAPFSTSRPRCHHQDQLRLHQLHATRHSFSRLAKRPLAMASHPEIRRRSSAADRTPVESSVSARTTTFVPADRPPSPRLPLTTARGGTNINHNHNFNQCITATQGGHESNPRPGRNHARTMPPPPLPAAEHGHCAAPSSWSLASRAHANRLSLTLPIAPPTRDPSRPMPSASTSTSTPSSVPPTSQDDSAVPRPSNVNEFIIAIAAKERKVMELKEEVAREEAELAVLKKHFSFTDALRKGGGADRLDLGGNRTVTPKAAEPDASSPSHSVTTDCRAQFPQNQGTPTRGRRRVMRGGHTRTLSLLSPTKANLELSALDGQTAGEHGRFSLTTDRRLNQAKRASWQHPIQQNSPVVPQIVEDFKMGLRAFVEDIRQITIGDEPINGQPSRRSHHGRHYRTASLSQGVYTDLRRSRSVQQCAGPNLAPEKPKPTAKSKQFSWTPLDFDSMDDTDWANWESSVPVKSTRWSGSTMNSGIMDDVQCVPENAEEATASTPMKIKPTGETPILSPIKLEELLPNVVNRLSPSNIKRTANHLFDEWEKSLVAPSEVGGANKENAVT